MTANARSSWLLDTGQTREDTRLTQLGATLPADALKVQSGILPGSPGGTDRVAGFWLKEPTAMTATIEPGRAVIQGMATQGAYPVTLSEPAVLTFDDGDQQGRIDLVCLHVYDTSYGPGAPGAAARLEVIKGQANATPTPPVVPDLALPLYYVSVPAGVSAGGTGIPWETGVTDLRTSTVATGGVLPVYGNATVPGGYAGQLRDNNDVIERWENGAWVRYPKAIGGIAPLATATGAYVGQYRDNSAGRIQRWDGTAWREVIPAYDYVGEAGSGGTTTSTTYVAPLTGSGTMIVPMTLAFTAPATGAVMITLGARMEVQTVESYGWMAVGLTQGTSVITTPSDNFAVVGGGPSFNSVSYTYRQYQLVPGLTYTATLWHRSNSSTGTAYFRNRYLKIDPAH